MPMPIFKPLHSRSKAVLLISLTMLAMARPAVAAELQDETLGLYGGWQEQPVSAGRVPKPLSQTAENVTVVTAAEIEALNAHTLADVLATISGIQVDLHGGPGSLAYTNVQSASTNHVQILVDGVSINNLGDNFSDISLVPAQIIERIEIVKGAASAAWGQALGGVINVITKSPNHRVVSGEASGSLGSRSTADGRLALSGTAGAVGYYLARGYLDSSGLLPNNQVHSSNGYAKLTLALPDNRELWSTLAYTQANRGEFAYQPYDSKADDSARYLTATLGFRTVLFEGLELELAGYHTTRQMDVSLSRLSDNELQQLVNSRECVSGGSAKLTWRSSANLLVAGSDFEHAGFKSTNAFVAVDRLERTVDRWDLYANDTLVFDSLAISGGIRVDHTASSGNQVSSSLGTTLTLNDSTVLRLYTAKGFSLPSINLDRPSERVWTIQTGFETSAIPYLWLKGTLFRNEAWDITVRDSSSGARSSQRQIALGGETELRTVPLFNTALGAGYTFTDTTRTSDGSQVVGAPRHTVQLALRYDDKRLLRAALIGRHIFWNADPVDGGRYRGLIWDLHLGATLYSHNDTAVELFCSGHNLFNGSQFPATYFQNPKRWYEAGIKVRF